MLHKRYNRFAAPPVNQWQGLLIQYALAVRGRVKQVLLVHGETKSALTLMGKLKEQGLPEVFYPELHQTVEI